MSRIGLLVPSSNTTVEPELYRALPGHVTLHVARLCETRIEPQALDGIVADLEAQSRNLAFADVDVIVLAATSPNLLEGLGYDREMIARIEAASGKPATTTSTALIEALRHLGASRIVVGSADGDEANSIARSFLEANGCQVLAAHGLGLTDPLAVGRLDASSACDIARRIDDPRAEAIVLAGANWNTMGVLERLEHELGKPVVSTTQAGVWAALRMIGRIEGIMGYGALLRDLTRPGLETQLA